MDARQAGLDPEIVELVLSWAVGTALAFVVVGVDERRMRPEMLARAWPTATRRASLVYFGLLALPVHFGRTRRSVLGILFGVGCALAIAAVDQVVADGVEELMQPSGTPSPLPR